MSRRPATLPQSRFNLCHVTILKYLNDQDWINESLVWQHQIEATKNIYDHLRDHNKPRIALCVLPTGSGKSGIAALSSYALNATRVLVITPSMTISSQLHRDFRDNNGSSFLVSKNVTNNDDFLNFFRPTCGPVIKKSKEIKDAFFDFDLIIANAHKFKAYFVDNGREVTIVEHEVTIGELPKNIDLVIVDEAHHYPAITWRSVIDYFDNSNKLFLTATPTRGNNKPILTDPVNPNFQEDCTCFRLSRQDLIDRKIIRPVSFDITVPNYDPMPEFPKTPDGNLQRDIFLEEIAFRVIFRILKIFIFKKIFLFLYFEKNVVRKVKEALIFHDNQELNIVKRTVVHQAMILCQTINGVNSISKFVDLYNQNEHIPANQCKQFIGGTHSSVRDTFLKGEFRTLVICGSLLEGFDNKNVSVLGIIRNVKSPVLFAQFVGRALRLIDKDDPVTAQVITDPYFKNVSKSWNDYENPLVQDEQDLILED